MNKLGVIFSSFLFLSYVILWGIKRRELLKLEGVDANVLFKATKPIQKYFSSLEKIMTALIVVVIIAHALFRNKFVLTNYIECMDSSLIKITGFAVGILGLTLCRIAQVTIGKSWRVGIDDYAKPGLITNGIYKLIRNPTYTGLFLLCAGVWIINPTILCAFWIYTFFIMIEFQVRCEEEYLIAQYGNQYLEYCKRTKRYFPLIY